MLTSKTPQQSADWCQGFDAGYQQATQQLRAALLDRLETLASDVRLDLRPWSCRALLEEVEVLIDNLDIEEGLPHD